MYKGIKSSLLPVIAILIFIFSACSDDESSRSAAGSGNNSDSGSYNHLLVGVWTMDSSEKVTQESGGFEMLVTEYYSMDQYISFQADQRFEIGDLFGVDEEGTFNTVSNSKVILTKDGENYEWLFNVNSETLILSLEEKSIIGEDTLSDVFTIFASK